jgi:hypothetical protein
MVPPLPTTHRRVPAQLKKHHLASFPLPGLLWWIFFLK